MLTKDDLEYYDRYRDLLKSEHGYTSSHINYGLLINGVILAVYFQMQSPHWILPWVGCALTAINFMGWLAAELAAIFFKREWVRYMKSRGVTFHTVGSLMPECKADGSSVFPPMDSPRLWQWLGFVPGGLVQLLFLAFWIYLIAS
jgi:hypothetical protein